MKPADKRETVLRAFASVAEMCAAEERKRYVRWQIIDALAVGEWLGGVS